jgi:general stress protein 26
MPTYRSVLILLGALPLLVAVGTFVAGEQIEVCVLRTFDAAGHSHDTKLWVVDVDGATWLRGRRAHLGWLERLRSNPRVELVRAGETERYVATVVESAEARQAVDAAMNAKYGWIERWYDLLLRGNPTPIRLDPNGSPH